MFVNSDFSDLLRLFNANRVRYLVVGGYAVVEYAEPRYTKDLDLWIGTTPDNADAVFRALRAFGAPLSDMTADDFAEDGFFYQMGMLPPLQSPPLQSSPCQHPLPPVPATAMAPPTAPPSSSPAPPAA